MFSRLTALLALSAFIAPFATAHSWVEEYQVISSNGSFVGPRGYSRGFVGRGDPTFNGFADEWELPSLEARNNDGTVRTRINSSDLLCHPAQRVSNYTSTYPKLQVQPGDYVAMKYLENGHTSLPWNITGKPPGGGTVFVFGTTQPKDDEKIVDVMAWNEAGTGGDSRGFLLTAQNFDDGRCHQLNCGNISMQRQMLTPNHVAGQPTSTVESWCETDLKIPENVTAGTLTTYWIWQWPTLPNMDCNAPAGKDEYYTTCADFDVVADTGTSNKIAMAPFSAAAGQNPQSAAVSDFKSRTAYTATPSVIMQENNKVVGTLSVNSDFVSSCSAQAPVISANSLGVWPEVYVPNTCSVVSTFGAAAASSAAAEFNKAAASYTSQRASVFSAAFAQAKVPLPTNTAWSVPYSAAGASPSVTAAPQTTSAPGYSTGSSTSQAVQVEVDTVTTVIVVTKTVEASDSASAPASSASAPVYSASSAASSSAPAYTTSSAASSAPAYSPSSAASSGPAAYSSSTLTTSSTTSSAAPNPYGISTVMTVGAAPSNGSIARRWHARAFR